MFTHHTREEFDSVGSMFWDYAHLKLHLSNRQSWPDSFLSIEFGSFEGAKIFVGIFEKLTGNEYEVVGDKYKATFLRTGRQIK